MSDIGYEQSIFSKDGKPLFFSKDKRVPVEMDYDKLQPFDEIGYISSIAKFIEQKSKNNKHDFNQIIETYSDMFQKNMLSVTPFLMDVLIENTGLTLGQIEAMPRYDVLQKLYELGCPELYAFHKTAQETKKFGTETFSNPKTIFPNPLAHPGNVSVTAVLKTIDMYSNREGDVNPYIIAFPLAEICKIQDKSADDKRKKGNDFNTGFVSFTLATPLDLNATTEKMKVFAIDQNRFQKLDSFSRQIQK